MGTYVVQQMGAGGNTSLGDSVKRSIKKMGRETMGQWDGVVFLPSGPKIIQGGWSKSLPSLPGSISRRAQPHASSALAIFTV